MSRHLLPALRLLLLLTFLTGLVFPLAVTVVGQLIFPRQANGSLLVEDGEAIGSAFIGQQFDGPRYFWSRPSVTEPPYNAAASAGLNLAPTSSELVRTVTERVAALRAADPGNETAIPVDLVTASGSGLDPHISVAAALYQAPRVAAARGLEADTVTALIYEIAEPRQLGILGEPRVNVVRLNLALDRLQSE
jgi:K+-transporting ATPase ATPase C chain